MLRKIYAHALRLSVVVLPDGNGRVSPACCGLGKTCKRLRALFSTAEIRELVMPQIRSIRYDFLRLRAAAAADAIMTIPHGQISLRAHMHMHEQCLTILTTVQQGHVTMTVAAENTTDRRGNSIIVRILMHATGTGPQLSGTDFENWLAMECLVTLQQTCTSVVNRHRLLHSNRRHCLFLL